MSPEKFAELVGYKPKCITTGLKEDPVRLICFRDFKKHSATVEFGCELNKKMKGFYFYFEVLDFSAYKEMDFIPLDSSMRHDVILSWPKCDEDYAKLASKVREALKRMYAKKSVQRYLVHPNPTASSLHYHPKMADQKKTSCFEKTEGRIS